MTKAPSSLSIGAGLSLRRKHRSRENGKCCPPAPWNAAQKEPRGYDVRTSTNRNQIFRVLPFVGFENWNRVLRGGGSKTGKGGTSKNLADADSNRECSIRNLLKSITVNKISRSNREKRGNF